MEVVVLVTEHARKAKIIFPFVVELEIPCIPSPFRLGKFWFLALGVLRIFCQAFSLSTRKKRKYIRGIYEHFDEVMCEKTNKKHVPLLAQLLQYVER